MAALTIFAAVFLAFAAKDGVHSCTLRNYKPECVDRHSSSSSSSSAASSSSLSSLSCGGPFKHYSDALNTISSNAPDSFSLFPKYKTPVISLSPAPVPMPFLNPFDHNQMMTNLLLNHLSFATNNKPLAEFLPGSFYGSAADSPPQITTTTSPSPTLDNNNDAQLKQLLSLLLIGPGSSLPSATPGPATAPPYVPVQNAMPAVPAATSPETAAPNSAPAVNPEPAPVTALPADVAATVPPSPPVVVPAAAPAPVPAAPESVAPLSPGTADDPGAAPTPVVPEAAAPVSPPAVPDTPATFVPGAPFEPAATPSPADLPAAVSTVPAAPVSAPDSAVTPPSSTN